MTNTSTTTLFITDDDRDDRDFLTEALIQNGFSGNIKNFENGEELINHLTAHPESPVELIVLDLNMPVKNGYETLKELKKNNFKDTAVVILTSSSKAEDEKYCYDLGCDSFKRKPLSFSGYMKLAEDLISMANG